MRDHILRTATDLAERHRRFPTPGGPPTLVEIAACAGITEAHLRTYYTSAHAIQQDLPADNAPAPEG